jgi:hypothetical protein
MNEEPGRVQPRRNIVTERNLSFWKRYEAVGYWALLALVLLLIVWFLVSSASDRRKSQDIEATIIATLFVPETATAEAEQTIEVGSQ